MIGLQLVSRHKEVRGKPQEDETMLKRFAAILVLIPGCLFADEWMPITEDAEITQVLANQRVVYDLLTFQYFAADGATQFITERASDGRWAARGGQYCSQWPPSDLWTCYDFETRGLDVRFISADGSISEGRIEP